MESGGDTDGSASERHYSDCEKRVYKAVLDLTLESKSLNTVATLMVSDAGFDIGAPNQSHKFFTTIVALLDRAEALGMTTGIAPEEHEDFYRYVDSNHYKNESRKLENTLKNV